MDPQDLHTFKRRMARGRVFVGIGNFFGQIWRVMRASRKDPALMKLGGLQAGLENADVLAVPITSGARILLERGQARQEERLNELTKK